MSDVPVQLRSCFEDADWRASERLPYAFGGGHDLSKPFQPSRDIRSSGAIGYDCSGWASTIIHHGGLLGGNSPLSTAELVNWGLPGEGEFMTLWVLHEPGVIEHTFLEFKLPEHPTKRWSMAAHTGTICGWAPYMDPRSPFVYHARRAKFA